MPNPNPLRAGRLTALGICVYLAGITWLVFGQTLRHPFLNYDDAWYVYQNLAVVKGLSAQGIVHAFTHPDILLWTPLTTISHMLDCQLFGLAPAGHHLTNVLLHAAAAILLFLALRDMTGALWRSAFVAAVFAVHPLRVESVAWISERKDVLSGVFFMLTLWAYVRYTRAGSRGWYECAALSFALGLLAKPSLVMMPFILLMLDHWPLGRMQGTGNGRAPLGRLFAEKIPLFLLSAASCAMTLFFHGDPIGFESPPVPSLQRIANAPVACMTYVRQTFWPGTFALIYPFPSIAQPWWRIALALAALGAISILVLLWRKKHPWLPVGWFWYLLMVAPVVGIVQVGSETHADRYTYLPQIGLLILITWEAAHAAGSWKHGREVAAGAAICALGALTLVSRTETSYWRDNEILWRRTLAQTSGSIIAHMCLGDALLVKGRTDEAIAEYRAATKESPDYGPALLDLGAALLQKGRLDEAIQQCEKAVKSGGGMAQAHYCLGSAFFRKGEPAKAVAEYEEAVKEKPDYIEACSNLAHILAMSPDAALRDGPKAVELAQKANELAPGNAVILSTLAAAYAESGRFPIAVETAGQALDIATNEGNTPLADLLEREIRGYESGSPWHEGN